MTGKVVTIAWVSLLWLVVADMARAESAAAYAITIDDPSNKAAVFPIEGAARTERMAVVLDNPYVPQECLIVGQPGRYAFVFEGQTSDELARGYLTEPGGKRRLVWLKVWEEEIRGRTVYTNPLHRLSPAEARGLRGVFVDAWSPQIAADLARLDLSHVCVTTSLLDAISPPVAAKIRYLLLSGTKLPLNRELRHLRDFEHLVFRSLNLDFGDHPFDAAWISGLVNLQVLNLTARSLEHPSELEALHGMRDLTLRTGKGIERVEFLRGMPNIQRLGLHGPVDLTPIRELTALVELDVTASPASHLPAVFLPALRQANLMSSKVSDSEAERFRALNPNALVLHRWTPQLRARLLGASEVTIETLRLRREDRIRSVTVGDATEIAKLIAALQIDDPPHFVSGCLPTHGLTFKWPAGASKVETIWLAEGNSVQWGGFPGDAPLTATSLREVRAWMARHGVDWTDCAGGPTRH